MWKQISLAVLLAAGLLACQTKERYKSFTPGQVWLDNNNVHINAHGGGILYDNGRYYWFGEHKTEGEGGNVLVVYISERSTNITAQMEMAQQKT